MASEGIDDERKRAAFRDRSGRVLYEALQRRLDRVNPGRTPGHPWDEIAASGRDYLSDGAEAVIDAFVTGQLADPPSGTARGREVE